MSINDKYRTKDVKRLILEKFFLNPDHADKYTLVQILGPTEGGELVINDNCNVFYAAKNVSDMQFVLRPKMGTTAASSPFSSSTSATDTSSMNGVANGGFYPNSNLQSQAKFTRHSFANINHSNTGYSHQLPPQPQGKLAKRWLKKILT